MSKEVSPVIEVEEESSPQRIGGRGSDELEEVFHVCGSWFAGCRVRRGEGIRIRETRVEREVEGSFCSGGWSGADFIAGGIVESLWAKGARGREEWGLCLCGNGGGECPWCARVWFGQAADGRGDAELASSGWNQPG